MDSTEPFRGIIDLLEQKAFFTIRHRSKTFRTEAVPDDMKEMCTAGANISSRS